MTLPHKNGKDPFAPPEPTKIQLRFLDELPKIYKKREEAMIENIRKTLVTDEKVNEVFEKIVNNINHSFKEKLDLLRQLAKDIKRKEDKEFAKKVIMERVVEIKKITDEMEEQNELISHDINMFAFESNKEQIESKKQNYKLQHLLEKIEQDSGKKTWT